jgi:hypothetical protein
MVDRCEHDLGVLLHDEFTLQLFLGADISKHKYDLSLTPKIMGFYSDVIKIAIYGLALNLILFC